MTELEDWLCYVKKNNEVINDLEELKMDRDKIDKIDKMLAVAQNMIQLDSELMMISPQNIISLILRIKELEIKIQELEHS